MRSEEPVSKLRTRARRLARIVAILVVSLVVLSVVARVIWRFSGSNQWELAIDKDGVKVYSLKAPGSDLIQARGIVRVRSTMDGLVAFMRDPAACIDYGCHDVRSIERVDDWLDYGSFRFDLPFPFKPREFVIRTQVHQSLATKEVLLVNTAAPHKAPPSDCCVRVTEMNNTLRFTPIGDGQIEIDYFMSMHEGGYLPDLMLNWQRPRLVYGVLRGMQRMLDRPKYRTAKLEYLAE
jgi:hypothetical protein